MEIIPAILPSSSTDLEEKLGQLQSLVAVPFVQVDAVDGMFAAPACWPYRPGDEFPRSLMHAQNFQFDADLMVANPEREAERFARAGASRITIHIESATDPAGVIANVRRRLGAEKGFAAGLVSIGFALSLETPLSLLEAHIAHIDYVQLMGIAHIGRQREPFDARVLPRIEALHKKYPQLPIQVDGGVSLTSAPLLLGAGATRLVIGSALFGAPDLASAFAAFRALE